MPITFQIGQPDSHLGKRVMGGGGGIEKEEGGMETASRVVVMQAVTERTDAILKEKPQYEE